MKKITVETIINADIAKVWEFWTEPKHIMNWAFASEDWESPYAENDLQVGGKFLTRMSAKDKSAGFDFEGKYDTVIPLEKIEYTMDDGRTVSILFEKIDDNTTQIIQEFEMEDINTEELQRKGWKSILENFKVYIESTT